MVPLIALLLVEVCRYSTDLLQGGLVIPQGGLVLANYFSVASARKSTNSSVFFPIKLLTKFAFMKLHKFKRKGKLFKRNNFMIQKIHVHKFQSKGFMKFFTTENFLIHSICSTIICKSLIRNFTKIKYPQILKHT